MRTAHVLIITLLAPVVLLAAACSPYYGDRAPYGRGTYEVSAVEVQRALDYNEHVDADDIRVDTRGDVVYLSGTVASEHQREEAFRAARSVRGVRDVVMDRLYVERGRRHG